LQQPAEKTLATPPALDEEDFSKSASEDFSYRRGRILGFTD
jgi:hypothetical protein